MSRRKPPVTTKAQRDEMADVWVKFRDKVEESMLASYKANLEAIGALLNLELLFGQPPVSPLNPEHLENFGKAMKPLINGGLSLSDIAADFARNAMAHVPRQYGATQTVPPPATAWRSMASAPRDGRRCVLLIGRIADTPIMRVGYLTGSGCHWRTDNGMLWSFSEIRAWAPIPEWTGEVAE